ncbi:hypothetical protein FOL47_006460 [Perkinsus chesapeaki]|uniref:RING-type domain-containing protein n=1 Tax=Perkinsus chesapeaki TaxID=330153 RepID=A0A7J6MY23_PERCH|nr:hypothetical protein FOL47_006460 [Perkinsus chesapeaki]
MTYLINTDVSTIITDDATGLVHGNLRRASSSSGGLPGWAAWTIAVAAIILCLAVIVTLYLIVRMKCELWKAQNTVVVQCAGCGRAIRIYHDSTFRAAMCRDCLRASMRRMSEARREKEKAAVVALEQNANERCDEVRKLERVSSTFFHIGSPRETKEDADEDEGSDSSKTKGSISRETSPDEQVAHPCKICMDAVATVVLLPCGHGGLCEGCAKDLVLRTTKCYMCRERIEMLGLVKDAGDDGELFHPVAPSHLHHLESRAQQGRRDSDPSLDDSSPSSSSGDIEEGIQSPTPEVFIGLTSSRSISQAIAAA